MLSCTILIGTILILILGDVIYVSMLRDPVELFRSWWDYNRLDTRYNLSLEQYALARWGNAGKEDIKQKRPEIFNQMLWDFGLDFMPMKNIDQVRQKINVIDATFDLILIAGDESFDDSMIILRDALCWNYHDVANFKLNSKKVEKKSPLSLTARKALQGIFL